MITGAVEALWRYPVSSLGGEQIDAAVLDATGIAGDRLWGMVDRATGAIARPEGEKRWRGAPSVKSRLVDGDLQVEIDGHGWLDGFGAQAQTAMADHFGFPVEIRRHGPAYSAPDVVAPRYRRAAIHLVTTASLRKLQTVIPDSLLDVRRFRPNIVMALPEDVTGFEEGRWLRREIRIGTVRLYVTEPCDRCAFTMLQQRNIPLDKSVLPAIASANGKGFGVYCSVLEGGSVATGDRVEVI